MQKATMIKLDSVETKERLNKALEQLEALIKTLGFENQEVGISEGGSIGIAPTYQIVNVLNQLGKIVEGLAEVKESTSRFNKAGYDWTHLVNHLSLIDTTAEPNNLLQGVDKKVISAIMMDLNHRTQRTMYSFFSPQIQKIFGNVMSAPGFIPSTNLNQWGEPVTPPMDHYRNASSFNPGQPGGWTPPFTSANFVNQQQPAWGPTPSKADSKD